MAKAEFQKKEKSLFSKLFKKKELTDEQILAKIKKKKPKAYTKKTFFSHFVEKSGIHVNKQKMSKILFKIAILVNMIITVYVLYYFATNKGYSIAYILLVTAFIWIVIFAAILFVVWLGFYLVIDLRIFKRKSAIEDVLPDFLQLASANIRSGMTIDKALWFAVRPQFGVLAKEIEIVAKETMTGADLSVSLQKFAHKYDSPVLRRTMNLITEGIRAGSEIGDLLDKVATNILETKTMRKEMAASVTSYTMFITFAVVVAAPVLYGLATQLLKIVQSLAGKMDMPAGGVGGFSFSFSDLSIAPNDYVFFCMFSLVITSIFSSIIISAIRYGHAKAAYKYIPVFIVVSLSIFYLSKLFLGAMLGSLF